MGVPDQRPGLCRPSFGVSKTAKHRPDMAARAHGPHFSSPRPTGDATCHVRPWTPALGRTMDSELHACVCPRPSGEEARPFMGTRAGHTLQRLDVRAHLGGAFPGTRAGWTLRGIGRASSWAGGGATTGHVQGCRVHPAEIGCVRSPWASVPRDTCRANPSLFHGLGSEVPGGGALCHRGDVPWDPRGTGSATGQHAVPSAVQTAQAFSQGGEQRSTGRPQNGVSRVC